MTSPYHQRLQVRYDYPVYFTRGALEPANPALVETVSRTEPSRRHRLFFVVDSGVAEARPRLAEQLTSYVEAYGERLEAAAAPEIIPGGEAVKTDAHVFEHLLARLHARGMDRQSCVVVIGGGAVQDVAGYAAAVAHRGIRLVRLPTTVASQNDSGVGVKNGLNAFGIKNFIGTFQPPFGVVIDFTFLETLATRDRIAGVAEAVKVALIRDRVFFDWLDTNSGDLAAFVPDAVEHMVRRGAELHLDHIAASGDPFELGSAKPLDFGHWAAHKLESMTGYELRHGEAVAIGMAIDTRYSVEAGLLGEHELARLCLLLERLRLPLWHPALAARDQHGRRLVLDGLREFREHLGGDLVLTMLDSIGEGIDVGAIDEATAERAIAWLERRRRRAA